jgi:hypothetical protein
LQSSSSISKYESDSEKGVAFAFSSSFKYIAGSSGNHSLTREHTMKTETQVIINETVERGRTQDYDGPMDVLLIKKTGGTLILGLRRGTNPNDRVDEFVIIPASISEEMAMILSRRWIAFVKALLLQRLIVNQDLAMNAWHAADTKSPDNSGIVARAVNLLNSHLGEERIDMIRGVQPGKHGLMAS